MEDIYDATAEDERYDATNDEQRLKRCARIAIQCGFDVTTVLDLVNELMLSESDGNDRLMTPGNRAAAAELASILREMEPILDRLEGHQDRYGLDLETLSMAVDNRDGVDQLRTILESIRSILSARQVLPKDEGDVEDPRAAMLRARVETASEIWFENAMGYQPGAHINVDLELELELEDNIRFIAEVLIAAGFDYEEEEVAPLVVDHRDRTATYYSEWVTRGGLEYDEWMAAYGIKDPKTPTLRIVR